MKEILFHLSDLACDIYHAAALLSAARELCALRSDPYTAGLVMISVLGFAFLLGYLMLDRFLRV